MGPVVPVRIYLLVFLSLIVLTGITTGVAFVDLGPLNTVVALAIAVCKMLLVILFFMHVRYSSPLTKIVVVAAFFWLVILISLTLSDFRTRNWTPLPAGWESAWTSGEMASSPSSEQHVPGSGRRAAGIYLADSSPPSLWKALDRAVIKRLHRHQGLF